MSTVTSSVTLSKDYFETLLRRAQFHTGGIDYSTPVDVATVTIPKSDHDNLLCTSRQYVNLRRNLFRGGIAEETFSILIKDDAQSLENGGTPNYSTVDDETDGGAFLTQHSTSAIQGMGGQDFAFGRNSSYATRGDVPPQNGDSNAYTNGLHAHCQTNGDFVSMPDDPDGFYDEGSGNNDLQHKSQRPHYDKFAKRTVLLTNLPDGSTHADVVDAVRGGILLDVYLRTHDRTASVSFLEEVAAHEFFRYVKRYDLYIRGKRIDVRWNDRQFILPGHVANKITIGATRNLVILGCTPKHTEATIRDDLEHIHNLIVIKVTFSGQKAYISTNSVHNAMFARTCMMSRSTYKGSKIEWDSDECAAPLERPFQHKENEPLKQNIKQPLMNRFQLLHVDGSDGSSNEDEDIDTSGLTFSSERRTASLVA